MKAVKTLVLVCLMLAASAIMAGAQLAFDILPSNQSGQEGDILTYSGTLRNTGNDELFLNGTNFNLNVTGLNLNDNRFFANAPISLAAGASWSGNLFDVGIGASALAGSHSGSFSILGGLDGLSQELLSTANFGITVQDPPGGSVYRSNFQEGDTTSWSHSNLSTDNNGRRTLGLFDNQNVSLTLPNLTAGRYSINYDLYTLFSWDGNGVAPNCCGPDYFRFQINGTDYIHATFANSGRQSYSTSTPFGRDSLPAGTDNTGVDLLSYTYDFGQVGNFRYTPSFEFYHAGGDMTFSFIGEVSQPNFIYLGFPDETWALDRVRVNAVGAMVPDPGTLALLGAGLVCAVPVLCRRTRRR